jgi:hypothetical protein
MDHSILDTAKRVIADLSGEKLTDRELLLVELVRGLIAYAEIQQKRIEELEARVQYLEARLSLNSKNSSIPLSKSKKRHIVSSQIKKK